MEFPIRLPILPGQTDPNPITDPGDVDPASVFRLPNRTDGLPGSKLVINLDGPPTQNAVVYLYMLDDMTIPSSISDVPAASGLADRKFYAFLTAATIVSGVASFVSDVPSGGFISLRITGGTYASPSTLLVGCAG